MFAGYFKAETEAISTSCMADIHSLSDWQARRPELRREAAEMLGLDPLPERTPLHPIVTGKLEREDFSVEKLYFESRPRLYVTANLYLPRNVANPVPAVLYLCGHTAVVSNGVSYGNKTAYQHHGIWFARNGYACLVLDTLQWGEIRGHHMGTFAEGAWWWNSRGYTPAGVETWNAIRGLDYLASRPEVDPRRIGVTGRSGGGAYSWFVAALDDRVKVVAPVAGITDLRNYVVDGAVDGHCDCMFFINTYRWDYPLLAALCAPRPLMLANSDADPLFPLDGVMRARNAVKRIYDFYGASTNFGLVIAPGPHKDTQDLQVPVFRLFNIHLKHSDPPIEMAALKEFAPQELQVFDKIPADQINTKIQESFVPMARPPDVPATAQEWEQLRGQWMSGLREKCFAGWPVDSEPPPLRRLTAEEFRGVEYQAYEIQTQPDVTLRLYLMRKAGRGKPAKIFIRLPDRSFTNATPDPTISNVFGTPDVLNRLAQDIRQNNCAQAVFLPRGIGPTAITDGAKGESELRRRFMLLGQTLDGMRVWDIRRAIQALRSIEEYRGASVCIQADGEMAVNALYASLFEPGIDELHLRQVPSSHAEGPDYLNVMRVLDIPQTAAMAAERCDVRLQPEDDRGLQFLRNMTASPAAKLKLRFEE
jgi:dienelactone hydrolase